MKQFIIIICTLLLSFSNSSAQENANLYKQLNLDYQGLERVKKAYDRGDIEKADKELLKYYRNRKGIELNGLDVNNVTISESEQQWADESLEHKFYAHKGYRPSYFYGDDINWRYWPIEDNELRWQLHRHYWFIPLAKAYHLTKDEKYAKAWIYQYEDWMEKNPLVNIEALEASGADEATIEAERINNRFAWRPMEAGRRVQDQLVMFALMVDSPNFTPQYLNMFLDMYYFHANHVHNNYSDKGNHLLFEAQRMLYAGLYFPEFKEAKQWREKGILALNDEVEKQVYDDGIQYELDFGYHIAAINIFLKALEMAQLNGQESEFPKSYIETMGLMTEFVYNVIFPDYVNPMFGDTKISSKSSLRKNFNAWHKAFPGRDELLWFGSDGKEGTMPAYTSKEFPTGGYYVMRSGWDKNATVALVKAGPPAFWHNQPDNGTFDYWHKGRNFFPDSGCYVYGGDAEVMAQRNWFRQTRVHNTVTLNEADLETTNSQKLLWSESDSLVTFVTENQSYNELKHRRSFFFVDNEVLVIVDEIDGDAEGVVGVNFNLSPSAIEFSKDGTFSTLFKDGNNIRIKTKSSAKQQIVMKEGWISHSYRKKAERPSYAVEAQKAVAEQMIFVTVIAPTSKKYRGSIAIVVDDTKVDHTLNFDVRIGANTYNLGYNLK